MLFTHSSTIHIIFEFVPSFVDEPATVGEKGAVDGVEDGKLSQSLHGKEQHETDNDETDELEDTVRHTGLAQRIACCRSHTTLPGPPLLNDEPEPTKRPAPMEPPVFPKRQEKLCILVGLFMFGRIYR